MGRAWQAGGGGPWWTLGWGWTGGELPVTWRVSGTVPGEWSRVDPSLHTIHLCPSSSRCSGWVGGVPSGPGERTRDRAYSQCLHTCQFCRPPESSHGNCPACLKQPWPSTWTGPFRMLDTNQRGLSSPTQDSEDPGQTVTCTVDPLLWGHCSPVLRGLAGGWAEDPVWEHLPSGLETIKAAVTL